MFKARQSAWVEIDALALVSNLASLRARAMPGTKIAAVLKANAFGHGLELVAPVLADRVDYLAAAEPGDAIRLADFAPGRVICLGPARGGSLRECVAAGIEVAVSTVGAAGALPPGARAHALVDTGLHRLGVAPQELGVLAAAIRSSGATLAGAFCHVAAADRGDWEAVEAEVRLLRQVVPNGVPTHVGGSSVLIERPDLCGDIARPGISLFGCHAAGIGRHRMELKQTLSLFAPILEVRRVPGGEPIGYDGIRLDHDTDIATLAVGVAHGIEPQRWPGGCVQIDGRDCPIVVRPSLDYTLVDVTDARAEIDQAAMVIGGATGSPTSVSSIAARTGVSPDDVLVRISPSLPRRLIGSPAAVAAPATKTPQGKIAR